MAWRRTLLFFFLCIPTVYGGVVAEAPLSAGRTADSTTKTIAEMRDAERRKIPIEVLLKAAPRYAAGGPVDVTVMVTNLFPNPLLFNTRMLVNHIKLQGELSFAIIGPADQRIQITRLVTPISLRDQDFFLLQKGQSTQRTLDLSDFYGIAAKGHYKVMVVYHNEADYTVGERKAWKGYLWSDPVEFDLE